MADQSEAVNEVEDTQPEPVPSSNESIQEGAETEAAGSQEVSQTADEPSLPEDVKDRTSREFSKLKSQLAQERERRLRYERMFSTQPPPSQQGGSQPNWYNQETGMVDVNILNNQLGSMSKQLDNAQRTIQGYMSREDERQAKTAYKAYPTLDPNRDEFDETFHDAVVGYLAGEFAKGKSPTMKQAADVIKKIGRAEVKQAEKEGAKKALEQLSPKEQAALEAESRSDKRTTTGNLQDLQLRTRLGDEEAVMERLKNIPPVGR